MTEVTSTLTHAGLRALCAVEAAALDEPLKVSLEGQDYAVFNFDGCIYVTQDACTHGPGSLSEGFVENGEIECPFHQGRFSLETGRPTAPPCTDQLKTWTVHVIGGQICIDPAEDRRGV